LSAKSGGGVIQRLTHIQCAGATEIINTRSTHPAARGGEQLQPVFRVAVNKTG
jgi:hypothetical protein